MDNLKTDSQKTKCGQKFNRMVHLCFKQAQPKMCHSPKVAGGVDFCLLFLENIFLAIFFEELQTAITPKPLKLLT